jgi:hypothetical protein
MNNVTPELKLTADPIIAEIRRRMVNCTAAIECNEDGGSGCGKSTLASLIAGELDAALMQGMISSLPISPTPNGRGALLKHGLGTPLIGAACVLMHLNHSLPENRPSGSL